MSEELEAWEAITPESLRAPVDHIRKMFDEAGRKCRKVTEILCFAELHPDDKAVSLGPYRSAFMKYRTIIGPAATQQFDEDHRVGTRPAIFHAFLQVFAAGIYTETRRLFKEVLQIGVVHSARLARHPVDWAKTHLSLLIGGQKHLVELWIKSVCDRQDHSRPLQTEQEMENFIFWKDWRAPKLIYMQPSGNLPYDPLAAWSREDAGMTARLLEGLSRRVIQFLGFDLDKLAGSAHVDLAKAGQPLAEDREDEDRRFAVMAIEEALKSLPEDGRPHPKVGAVIVRGGEVLAKSHRGEEPKSHAEYVALEVKLSDVLVSGATVYTTLEPCTTRNHPKIPCAQRLVERKVARVVIGMLDPNPDIMGRGELLLSEAGIDVQLFPGDLKNRVREMNREFIRAQTQRHTAKGTSPTDDRPEATVSSEQLAQSDIPNRRDPPRLYVYLGAADQMGFPRTEFVLRNLGGDVAHKIQIEPLKLASGEATFPRVEILAANEDRIVLPEIEQFGVLQKNDLSHLMMKEWDAAGKLEGEFSRPMRIEYEDYLRNRFRTVFDLVYLPLKAITRRNHPGLSPPSERHVFEIRNVEISKAPS